MYFFTKVNNQRLQFVQNNNPVSDDTGLCKIKILFVVTFFQGPKPPEYLQVHFAVLF